GGSGGGLGKPDNSNEDGGGSEEPQQPNGSGGGSGKPQKPQKPNNHGEGNGKPEQPNKGNGTTEKPEKPNNSGGNAYTPSNSNKSSNETGNASSTETNNRDSVNRTHRSSTQNDSNSQSNNGENSSNSNNIDQPSMNQTTENNQNRESNEHQLMNRFNQMTTGSFKYNPFVLNQVKQLGSNKEQVSDSEISAVLKKQNFADNAFLNELQKDTNYFKFQYFNPLKSRDYYKNLDKQVLALITGDIGSMPDLKKPENKNTTGKYEYHTSSDEEMTHTKDKEASDTIQMKFERTLFALITAMLIIFVGVVIGYFVRRKNDKLK
ncbi:SdrH family protein, partial [Staphylococcus saprophyticus]|uniref:SdrH family protein n=1 Tax=Staphylococcus saprophyticus TaxID=29385 RepID=UPI000ABE7E8E